MAFIADLFGGSKKSREVTTTQRPVYPPEAAPVFRAGGDLLLNRYIPGEQRFLADALAILTGGEGEPGGTGSAPLRAAAQLGTIFAEPFAGLPPLVISGLRTLMSRLPTETLLRLRSGLAPEVLGEVESLVPSQSARLFAPRTQTTQSGGGPSTFQTAAGAAQTAASIASLIAIL